MATTLSTLISRARDFLVATGDTYWSDAELLAHAQAAIEDLWKAVLAAGQKHIITSTASTLSANVLSTDLPLDFGRMWGVEVTNPTTNVNVIFTKKSYFSAEFQAARFADAVEPRHQTILYDLMNQGGPTDTTATLKTAPKVSSDMAITIWYTPTISALTTASTNPIPGHSDNAVVAWIVAFARAKEREDRAPDSEWVTIYSTEKTNLTNTVLEPRDAEAQEHVEGLFESYWQN